MNEFVMNTGSSLCAVGMLYMPFVVLFLGFASRMDVHILADLARPELSHLMQFSGGIGALMLAVPLLVLCLGGLVFVLGCKC